MNAGIADGLRLLTIRFSCSFKFKSESKKPFVSVSFQHILMDFPSAVKFDVSVHPIRKTTKKRGKK
ncbi:hypothetical protein OUZ56_015881 [Daphnia magna]|uniref:Uncharacterized protein n=1 Tax=Daphnia magna TaxID=35525 RepID=A0ABR0AP20_9CRUS|nr:hypothetical protein OUZ56_015881 [Daphnia magna]